MEPTCSRDFCGSDSRSGAYYPGFAGLPADAVYAGSAVVYGFQSDFYYTNQRAYVVYGIPGSPGYDKPQMSQQNLPMHGWNHGFRSAARTLMAQHGVVV